MGTAQAFLKRLLFRWKYRNKFRHLDLIKEGRLEELSNGVEEPIQRMEVMHDILHNRQVEFPPMHQCVYHACVQPFHRIQNVGLIVHLLKQGADVYEMDRFGRTPLALLQETRELSQLTYWWGNDEEPPNFAPYDIILNTVETVLMDAMRKPILEAVKQQLEEAPKAQRRM